MYKNRIDRDSYLPTDTEWVEFKENYKDYE